MKTGKPSGTKCRKCGHDVTTHVGGTGKCTVPGCLCLGREKPEAAWFEVINRGQKSGE